MGVGKSPKREGITMALRDFWRGMRGDHERQRYPLDPLSRDSWRDEAEARYGAGAYRDDDEERSRFNDRWENSYGGRGRFRSQQESNDEARYGGSHPFYGDRPLMRAGAARDRDYVAPNSGLPMTPWRQETNDQGGFDELVYGGRSFDADASSQRARGGFRGRGPRNYRRSDERIREDVCQCLTDDPHVDATNVEVSVADGEVTLSGTVASRMQKRRAEEVIEQLPGVRDVINGLRVVSDSSSMQSSMQSSGAMQSTATQTQSVAAQSTRSSSANR